MENTKTLKIEYPADKQIVVSSRIKKYLKSDYVRAFQEGLSEIICDKDLSGEDVRIFFGIVANLEYENIFRMPLAVLSRELGIDRSNISKSVSKLVQKNYLTKINSQGRVNHYMADPRIAFKSRASKLDEVVNQWDDLPLSQN